MNTENLCSQAPGPRTPAAYTDARGFAALFDPPLSIGTVRKLQRERAIPFARIGRRVVFNVEAAKAAIADHLTVQARGGR